MLLHFARKSAGGSLFYRMFKLTALKSASTLGDLAALLHFKSSALSFVIYKTPTAGKYTTFDVPKRTGGVRTIQAPFGPLKLIQRRLSGYLQDCLDEIEVTQGKISRASHGFKRKRSILTNAKEHRNRRYVFNVDLQDFFPSINFGRVRGYFINDKRFLLNSTVATAIAQIACRDGSLPQGSPCSPVISNLIAHILDIHLVRLAESVGCTYTRYADDLSFSTNLATFPPRIATASPGNPHCWLPGPDLHHFVTHSGFLINPSKTHMQYRDSRQQVTGLVVNKKLNIRFEYRHLIRAMVTRLLSTGSFQISPATDGYPSQLHGMLGFIDDIDLANKRRTKARFKDKTLTSNETIYQRFLLYTMFYAAPKPVIICEGETDNVYLIHAIRSLAVGYPQLASIDAHAKVTLNVRLFRYRLRVDKQGPSSTCRILNLLDGGSGCLNNFIALYKKQTTSFSAPGQQNPVIILFDNDSGSKSIKAAVKEACGKVIHGTEPFMHVVNNLYVVPTPLTGGATESKIEDFFDSQTKSTTINGKDFDQNNDFETATSYGKKVFAYKVVREGADTIDFSGFHPLLTNLAALIDFHKSP